MTGLTKCDTKTAQISEKNSFTIKNEIEAESLSLPKSIRIITVLRLIPGPNLVILSWTGDKLSCREAQNGTILDFWDKFDPEGYSQSIPKTIGILTILRCISGPNLVNLN